MRNKIYISFVVLFLFVSCSTTTVKYKCKTYEKPQEYTVFTAKIPSKFKRVEKFYDNSYEVFFVYSDSSAIFFSNNKWSGSQNNKLNRIESKLQDSIIFKKSLTDSIYLSNIQKNGKLWKENVLNDVIIGYKNVDSKDQEKFDIAIKSIRRKQ
jgi:hypothetical protein